MLFGQAAPLLASCIWQEGKLGHSRTYIADAFQQSGRGDAAGSALTSRDSLASTMDAVGCGSPMFLQKSKCSFPKAFHVTSLALCFPADVRNSTPPEDHRRAIGRRERHKHSKLTKSHDSMWKEQEASSPTFVLFSVIAGIVSLLILAVFLSSYGKALNDEFV